MLYQPLGFRKGQEKGVIYHRLPRSSCCPLDTRAIVDVSGKPYSLCPAFSLPPISRREGRRFNEVQRFPKAEVD